MIADFHNDCLTSEKARALLSSYAESDNAVVCAFFKGRRGEADAFSAVKLFSEYGRSENRLFLSFEDFSFENEQTVERLLDFNPVCVSLTWNGENFLAGGAFSVGDLTPAGERRIALLNERKIPLDVAHLNERSFFSAYEKADTVVCTHCGFKGVKNHLRNLSDEQIKLVLEKNGLVGLAFYSGFLAGGEDAVFQSLDYFVQRFGCNGLCLGTDFNGCNDFPVGYGDYFFEEGLRSKLVKYGYSSADVDGIFYENLLGFLKGKPVA